MAKMSVLSKPQDGSPEAHQLIEVMKRRRMGCGGGTIEKRRTRWRPGREREQAGSGREIKLYPQGGNVAFHVPFPDFPLSLSSLYIVRGQLCD